ncbi:NADH:flavin oxidoreductase [Bradyrhizobium ivorense]|uniref:NADH:flavin oxidoreductase n=1 Tax=Bradyrhizobium ivorense TaxID=2511166 RepID=UPI0010B143E5|nr:NADH:flavin oxidoreductase [Bradyrhizobium ivorense]VIO71682.1 NADH oxidase [Bradyrhizobium ivorense]
MLHAHEMTAALTPISFKCGPSWRNRLMLAPMTNYQSADDGRLSEDDRQWLDLRAKGGFGMVMTCAAHVRRDGQGFVRQLGVFSDDHLPGLTELATTLKRSGAVCAVQLQHSGVRALQSLTGSQPFGPSDVKESGARAMTGDEVEAVVEDFVAAAVRAECAGFDGVELHAAHGFLLCNFLSPVFNRRNDAWGGSLEHRARILIEIIEGVRRRVRPDFQLGLRLSPERYGLRFEEQRELTRWMLVRPDLDYVDLSLWDAFAAPVDPRFAAGRLIDRFADLPRGIVRLGVAGRVRSGAEIRDALSAGADFVAMGHAGILHHDFPRRLAVDPDFGCRSLPVSEAELRAEGVGGAFLDYFKGREGFVIDEEPAA